MTRPWLVGLAVLFGGCLPYTAPPGYFAAGALSREYTNPGPALVAYLSQSDADAGVCDLYRQGPTVTLADAEVVDHLHKGFERGRVKGSVYAECLTHLWDASSDRTWEHVVGSLMAKMANEAPRVNTDVGANRLKVYRWVISHHSGARPVPSALVNTLASRLRDVIADPAMTSGSRALLNKLIEDVEVEAGLWKGRPVTAEDIDGLEDESRLVAWAQRLPGELRTNAQQRLVALRLERTPFAVVKKNATAVRAALRDKGYFALPTAVRIDSVRVEPRGSDASVLHIEQRPSQPTSLLTMQRSDGSTADPPGLDLRYVLWAEGSGIEEPITLCPAADPWDPTPCLDPSRVSVEHPLAGLSESRLLFRGDATLQEVMQLASGGDDVAVPIKAAGHRAEVDMTLSLAPVRPLRYSGGSGGGRGPDLTVDAWELPHDRLMLSVRSSAGGNEYNLIVDDTMTGFSIETSGGMGARGEDGQDGRDGQDGTDGYNAVCPSTEGTDGGRGTDGEDGTDGGPGGRGGDGGNVTVLLRCKTCSVARGQLQRMVFSSGGAGGPGGQGGQGGDGGKAGEGGDSARCEYYDDFFEDERTRTVNGGSRGWAGQRGSNGSSGPWGPEGNAGSVDIRVVGRR